MGTHIQGSSHLISPRAVKIRPLNRMPAPSFGGVKIDLFIIIIISIITSGAVRISLQTKRSVTKICGRCRRSLEGNGVF